MRRVGRRWTAGLLAGLLLTGCSLTDSGVDDFADYRDGDDEPYALEVTQVFEPDDELPGTDVELPVAEQPGRAEEALRTVFDPVTARWFALTCDALHQYDELVDSLAVLTGEVADDPEATRDIALGGLQPFADMFSRSALTLRELEPPAEPDGADVHSGVVEAFGELDLALSTAVEDLERADISSVDTVLESTSAVGENLLTAIGLANPRAEMKRLAEPEPDQLAVVRTVVGCRTQHFS